MSPQPARRVSPAARVLGIDISNLDGNVDLAKAHAAGIRFAIHKATGSQPPPYSAKYVDRFYEPNRARAKAAGVAFGAYHFGTPGVGSAKEQAEHFLKVAKPRPGDLAPALDLEQTGGKSWRQVWEYAIEFLTIVQRAHGAAILYTTPSYLERLPKDLRGPLLAMPGLKLWIAHVNANGAERTKPPAIAPFESYAIWQYGWKGRVPGVRDGRGDVDLDQLAAGVKLADLRVGEKKPPPPPPPRPPAKKTYRQGDLGPEVKHRQELLQSNWTGVDFLQDPENGADGDFGPNTGRGCERAKEALGYPRASIRPVFGEQLLAYLSGRLPLPADYKRRRRDRLAATAQTWQARFPMHALLVAWALAEFRRGVHEDPLGSNRGARVQWYQAATWLLGTGWPWCVAFWQRGIQVIGFRIAHRGAHAWNAADWAAEHGLASSIYDAIPGDGVAFKGGAGHWAMLLEPVKRGDTTVKTIDGNVSDRVGPHERPLSQIYGVLHLAETKALQGGPAKRALVERAGSIAGTETTFIAGRPVRTKRKAG